MPICPRLAGTIYPRLTSLVASANEFIFFGTYSLSVDRSILNRIINKKQRKPDLLVACLLPPPTDFILWDFSIRSQIYQAYQQLYQQSVLSPEELARLMAIDPQPAYSFLDNLWVQRNPNSFQRSLLDHIQKIAELYQNQVIVFLEPNMHAKFVASESNVYEGSGNLTRFGLKVNVEVYNFYPRTAAGGKVYEYAVSSYIDFLSNYLTNFVDWKSGRFFLRNAQQLGTRILSIAQNFGVTFNPKVTREKIELLTEAREQLSASRSDLWQLPGHKLLLKLDFGLSQADIIAQRTIAKLWALNNQEIEKETSVSIMKDLEVVASIIRQVAPLLEEIRPEPYEYYSWYEKEYLQKVVMDAMRFKEYLSKFKFSASQTPPKRDE